MNRTRIIILPIIILVISSILISTQQDRESYICANCNIILVTFDSLRADHMGFNGYSRNTTPFMDSLSRNSVVFPNAVSQSGSTLSSISSIFTSRYPLTDGVVQREKIGEEHLWVFNTNQETLAEVLRDNGYETKAVVGNLRVNSIFGISKGFQDFDDDFLTFRKGEQVTDLSIQWLQSRNKEPFFLWIHYFEPHCPYIYPSEYQFFNESFSDENRNDKYIVCGFEKNITSKDVHDLNVNYDRSIKYADENLGKLFGYLKYSGLLNRTVVIITSDHGESTGEHEIFDHNDVYYGIIHVPLIIVHPNLKHEEITRPVSLVDIFPTIIDILNLNYNETTRGKSIFAQKDRDSVQYSEDINFLNEEVSTIIWNNFKLIRKEKVDYLFDISRDPNESLDIKEGNKKAVEELANRLDQITQNPLHSNLSVSIDKERTSEVISQLRTLGYWQ